MKKLLLGILSFCAVFNFFALDDDSRQALYGAVDSSKSALEQAPFGQASVAVLPIAGDDGTIAGRLKNLLTQAKFTVVEGKDEPMWEEILKEIAWDERKDDILDPATLVKFGKLKATQILLYGKINKLDRNSERVYAELELHATELATKRHIWGGNFAYRFYKGGDVQGIVSLNSALRELLKKNFTAARESLTSPEYAGKLNDLKSVTVIPLAGDVDQYMTGLAIENLTMTRLTPKNPLIPSLSQVRAFVRDGQLGTDGIFYGAVRDLARTAKPNLDTLDKTAYEVTADIQLFLEDARTGGILWSKTVTLKEMEMVPKHLTETEKAGVQTLSFMEKHSTVLLMIGGVLLGLIVLGVMIAIIRSASSVR